MEPDADLTPLKIDRSRSSRGRSGSRLVYVGLVVVVVGVAGFLLRGRILGLVDRVRFPEVVAIRVVKRSAAAAGAASGAAANGYIVAKTRAALSADTPGRIVEMNVEEGSVVHEGDVVARLYSKEYAAAVRRAEAELELGRATVERQKASESAARYELAQLSSNSSVTEAGVKEAEADHALAAARFERIQKLVKDGIENLQRLDDAQAELDGAVARLASAKARNESARAAEVMGRERVLVAEAAVREAEANVEVLAAARDLARATLEKTEVRAPFDGVVVLKDAEVGEVVSPNSQGGNSRGSVVTMVDFESLEVQAEVPETSLSAVRIGGSAAVYLDAWPDHPYACRVDRIWPTANRQKATVEVRVAFLERDERLRPELGVRVVFLDEDAEQESVEGDGGEPRVMIPASAVVERGGESGVFTLVDDVVRFRRVALGVERSGRYVVERGLEGGEDLVVEPKGLADGDRVRVRRNR